MTARAVIGANFGDEGKGSFVDYLANKGGEVVVRFNGGCQAGHTVVAPGNLLSHVFSHFGSGSLAGLPTFFSQHTIVNPVLFIKEYAELCGKVPWPSVYIHPDARVTTPWDMNANQDKESERLVRHGSCGVGIFETVKRSWSLPLLMKDLFDDSFIDKLDSIMAFHRCADIEENAAIKEKFIKDAQWFAGTVRPATISDFSSEDIIFEGAQGLLLCQSNMDMYPHLTPSRCGMHNVRELCYEGNIVLNDTYYVTRTYMTRHGDGPMENEYTKKRFADSTNQSNPWQGKLRFGPMDWEALMRRIHADSDKPKLVVTHCDQEDSPAGVGDFQSYGPTRDDMMVMKKTLPKRAQLRAAR